MQRRIIVVSAVNLSKLAQERANTELSKLEGADWKIVSAITTAEIFGVVPGEMPPIHHALYTTTIALEKPENSARENLLEMRLEDFFTERRFDEVGLNSKWKAKFSRMWEWQKFEHDPDPPKWTKELPKLKTVGDLIRIGPRRIQEVKWFHFGPSSIKALEIVLGHNGIEFV